jgi:hypothetical protein
MNDHYFSLVAHHGSLVMPADNELDIRPRTTGEIFDDAWRLYLADVAVLWVIAGLFYAPLAVLILLLVTERPSENLWMKLSLPILTALAVPWTGVGAGACQEALRRRPGGTLISCLGAALRNGFEHAAARALIAGLTVVGLFLLVLPGLTVWGGSGAIHAVLVAKEGRLYQALQAVGRESQRQPGKVLALLLGRGALMIFAVLNLHMLFLAGVWVGENLAGFDWAALAAGLSLVHNPTYVLVLLLFAGVVLAPYSEAVNYLFHVDSRARFEGLDLWHRVHRQFGRNLHNASRELLAGIPAIRVNKWNPTRQTRLLSWLCFLLFGFLAWPLSSQAADTLRSVDNARREISVIREEVKTKQPFPGGQFWVRHLQQVADHLDPGGNRLRGKYRWLHEAVEGFRHRNREDALIVLEDIDQKLGLIEENLSAPLVANVGDGPGADQWSKEQIKELLPMESEDSDKSPKRDSGRQRRRKAEQRQIEREDEGPPGTGGRGDSGLVAPAQTTGLSAMGWILFWGILLAVSVAALVMTWRNWTPKPKSTKTLPVKQSKPSLEEILAQSNPQTVAELWRQAEDLARQGRFLEAVRSLYLAVLAFLHRTNRIRYEPTRTNGEYVDQLRADGLLQDSFRGLTGIFELKWYGERACGLEDFAYCRQLAEDIRKFDIQRLDSE